MIIFITIFTEYNLDQKIYELCTRTLWPREFNFLHIHHFQTLYIRDIWWHWQLTQYNATMALSFGFVNFPVNFLYDLILDKIICSVKFAKALFLSVMWLKFSVNFGRSNALLSHIPSPKRKFTTSIYNLLLIKLNQAVFFKKNYHLRPSTVLSEHNLITAGKKFMEFCMQVLPSVATPDSIPSWQMPKFAMRDGDDFSIGTFFSACAWQV